jgi:hypothetical protein
MTAQPAGQSWRWSLLALAASVSVWVLGCAAGGSDAGTDAGGRESMRASQISTDRPPIDLAAATEFETATFALG